MLTRTLGGSKCAANWLSSSGHLNTVEAACHCQHNISETLSPFLHLTIPGRGQTFAHSAFCVNFQS